MILGAFYLLWMLERVIFGPLREPGGHASEHGHGHESDAHGSSSVRPIGWHEVLGLAPLMVLIVAIGVLPGPFLDRIRPTVAPVAARFRALEEEASRRVERSTASPEKLTRMESVIEGRR
jgi:NADH-quinone oxidoreductase subunit M